MDAKDVLFSKTQQRVLLALFREDASEGLTYAEILRRTEGGSGAIHRELSQFLAAGLVIEKGGPRQRLFVANRDHAVYPEMRGIVKKLFKSADGVKPGKRTLDPIIARTLSKKYLWWMKADEVILDQDRLVAQVMNLGSLEDILMIEDEFGEDYLRRVLKRAAPGQFDDRSWTYWHYRLDMAKPGHIPPLPQRRFA